MKYGIMHIKAADNEFLETFSVRPEQSKGSVLVIHEVWGLSQEVERVCKLLGRLGFTAIAPNLYSRDKTLFTPQRIRLAMKNIWSLSLQERYDHIKLKDELNKRRTSQDVVRLTTKLYDHSFRDAIVRDIVSVADFASKDSKLSTIGFSMGSRLCLSFAARFGHLRSAIAFYGDAPPPEEVKNIKAPVLAIYAGHDEIVNPRVPDFVQTMIKYRKPLTLKLYPNARHGFFNNQIKNIEDRKAAYDSWYLVRRFLAETLR